MSPSASALPSSVAAEAPSVSLRVLTVYTVLLTAVLQVNLPELMRSTGAPGSALMAVAYLPLYVIAVRAGLAPFRAGPSRALVTLIAALTPSLLWSEHPLDGAIKFTAMGTAVAWAALLTTWPALLGDILGTGLAYCVVGTAAAAAGVSFLPQPSSSFALFVLFAAVIRWREVSTSDRIMVRGARSFALVALVGLVFVSTFRAPTIGALLVVACFAVTSREARVALLVATLAGGVFFSVENPKRAPSYTATVERSDLVGRYESISDDRFSGRGDIWEGILDDARTGPTWLFVGGGLGDVDFLVADANPHIMSFNIRGERVLSPHNLALEVLVAAGIPGTLALLWLLLVLAARLGDHSLDAGLLACMIVMSGSNVPLIDTGGGVLCVALICTHLGRKPVFWLRRAA